jgi:putative nucleotidyltransferase with HDIG domain
MSSCIGLLERGPHIQAHCQRVAALAGEIAALLGLSAESRLVLEQAALVHHAALEAFTPPALDRLVRDVGGAAWRVVGSSESFGLLGQASELVRAMHHRGNASANQQKALLTGILEAANLFDERLQFSPYEDVTAEQIRRDLVYLARESYWPQAVATAFERLWMIRDSDLRDVAQGLPVFPAVVFKALALTADSNVNLGQLEKLLASDQVLAGQLIRAANSSLHGARQPVATIRHAASYLGLELSRKIIAAAAMKPLVASTELRTLWRHSLETAEKMEWLAVQSGVVPPMEAYLTGLVHDVGRLVMFRSRSDASRCYARLLERGCPPVVAEQALAGRDHGEIGATVLTLWKFPSHIREAVRHHHRPEKSEAALPSLLYSAESSSNEDVPSGIRLDYAAERAAGAIEKVYSELSSHAETVEELLAVA